MSETIAAGEACRRLGIRAATLYSYVSRGLLRSEPGPGRGRRYRTEDVERLRRRQAGRRDPERAVRESLHWGTPVLDSALTLIQDGRLWYRGQDAIQLATTHTLEDVAALLWGQPLAATSRPEPALVAAGAELDLVSRLQAVLPVARAHDL
ncbi:MAG: citrate synthase, partial [Candidatus Dormiibacterota bacterium]